ncbi:hypothetical protein EUTSA_v10019377mg [Eutrema salsugineum]|uniref:Uncharacterized protein n=1 Tax=Eutrema salsugineum TaxID=72664 RepID=V4KBF6_EUTSA|nr:hypothetical protein EUTSA_v10019377mg [Eutrema salsugineum]
MWPHIRRHTNLFLTDSTICSSMIIKAEDELKTQVNAHSRAVWPTQSCDQSFALCWRNRLHLAQTMKSFLEKNILFWPKERRFSYQHSSTFLLQ